MRLIKMANQSQKICYKLVLTGGPCGGKTTGQSRLCTFFENLGWKVFRVPETATVLLSGGVKFADLSPDEGIYCSGLTTKNDVLHDVSVDGDTLSVPGMCSYVACEAELGLKPDWPGSSSHESCRVCRRCTAAAVTQAADTRGGESTTTWCSSQLDPAKAWPTAQRINVTFWF
ncbi:unnamed protein product [Plutella xylostella]|uniref:(diamondback moth) hypothetical protein n=1 Tax=Plutella xylostella TaxID=51655 RepID=A0A8S4DD82_PLUXY|nr:unnamed protein product [Plutella xylostella]